MESKIEVNQHEASGAAEKSKEKEDSGILDQFQNIHDEEKVQGGFDQGYNYDVGDNNNHADVAIDHGSYGYRGT